MNTAIIAGLSVATFMVFVFLVCVVVQIMNWKRDAKEKKINALTIRSRTGKIDIIIPDGKYNVDAEITIEEGKIKYIDNGKWIPSVQEASQ